MNYYYYYACTPPCCACSSGTEEPPTQILKKAASSRIAGNAIDYFYCNSEKTENKKCVYVYISARLYTHTPKINILWSFKPRAKPGKLVFMLESLLAPKAKDCPWMQSSSRASLQLLHLLLFQVEGRLAKSLLHMPALLPQNCQWASFQPTWLSPLHLFKSAWHFAAGMLLSPC